MKKVFYTFNLTICKLSKNDSTTAFKLEVCLLHHLFLAVSLAVTWLLLSGVYDPLILLLGLVSCGLVVIIAMRMDVIDHEAIPVHLSVNIFFYWLWLLIEIVKANIDVTKRVLGFSPISPTMVRIKTSQKSDLGLVIFANSITLTPGTISIDVEKNGYILVHSISLAGTKGLEGGEMDRRVAALEAQN